MDSEQITWDEMQEAWYRFWGKNKLAITENGEVYRTNVPRVMPCRRTLDFRKNESKNNVTTSLRI